MFSKWGSTVTKQLPAPVVDLLLRKLRKTFIRKFAARAGGSLVGRLLPFGIGAIIGGVVNAQMSRKVADESKEAFGSTPTIFPLETDPEYVAPKKDRKLLAGLKNVAALRGKIKKNKAIESDVIDEAAEEDASNMGSSNTDASADNRTDKPTNDRTGNDSPELGK